MAAAQGFQEPGRAGAPREPRTPRIIRIYYIRRASGG